MSRMPASARFSNRAATIYTVKEFSKAWASLEECVGRGPACG
jgi:hypothetical protein